MSTAVITEDRPATGPADDVTAAAAALRALAAADGGDVLAGQLSRLVAVIATEAVRTKRFRTDLLEALVPAPVAGAAGDGEAPRTRSALQKLTIAKLRTVIDREGMDPDRTLRSRTTKGQLIDVILAFQASAAAPEPVAPDPVTLDDPATAVVEDPTLPPANPPKRRRRPAPLDPYAIAASDGVEGLRQRLRLLDVEELKDVIAEYGMNYDGRAMSWRDHHRFVDRIVEKADFGATQGNAFRSGR